MTARRIRRRRPDPAPEVPTRPIRQVLREMAADVAYLELKLALGERLAPSELATLEAARQAAAVPAEGGGS